MQIGKYRTTGRIGGGGMGEVFSAQNPGLDGEVAIKLIRMDRQVDIALDTRRKLLKEEARNASRLNNYPAIVSTYDCDEHEGNPYIVMERVYGASVERILARGRPPHRKFVRQILVLTGEALVFAHRKKILHRDIKPANILVNFESEFWDLGGEARSDSAIKICDFGLAQRRDSATAARNTGAGTLSYMAPEVQEGGEASEYSDMYALGVVSYELLTGRLPFTGKYRAPSEINDSLPGQVDRVFDRVFDRDVANRRKAFENCEEFVKKLLNACDRAKNWQPLPRAWGSPLPAEAPKKRGYVASRVDKCYRCEATLLEGGLCPNCSQVARELPPQTPPAGVPSGSSGPKSDPAPRPKTTTESGAPAPAAATPEKPAEPSSAVPVAQVARVTPPTPIVQPAAQPVEASTEAPQSAPAPAAAVADSKPSPAAPSEIAQPGTSAGQTGARESLITWSWKLALVCVAVALVAWFAWIKRTPPPVPITAAVPAPVPTQPPGPDSAGQKNPQGTPKTDTHTPPPPGDKTGGIAKVVPPACDAATVRLTLPAYVPKAAQQGCIVNGVTTIRYEFDHPADGTLTVEAMPAKPGQAPMISIQCGGSSPQQREGFWSGTMQTGKCNVAVYGAPAVVADHRLRVHEQCKAQEIAVAPRASVRGLLNWQGCRVSEWNFGLTSSDLAQVFHINAKERWSCTFGVQSPNRIQLFDDWAKPADRGNPFDIPPGDHWILVAGSGEVAGEFTLDVACQKTGPPAARELAVRADTQFSTEKFLPTHGRLLEYVGGEDHKTLVHEYKLDVQQAPLRIRTNSRDVWFLSRDNSRLDEILLANTGTQTVRVASQQPGAEYLLRVVVPTRTLTDDAIRQQSGVVVSSCSVASLNPSGKTEETFLEKACTRGRARVFLYRTHFAIAGTLTVVINANNVTLTSQLRDSQGNLKPVAAAGNRRRYAVDQTGEYSLAIVSESPSLGSFTLTMLFEPGASR